MWRDAFWVGLGQLITVPMAVLTTVIIARFLSLKEFGLYQLVLSYVAIAKITTLPGMNSSLMKGAVKGYDGFFYKAIRLSFYTSLIGSTILFLSGIYLIFFRVDSAQLGYLLVISGVIFPIFVLEKSSMVLIGKKQFRISRQWAIISSFLSLVIIGLTAYFSKNLVCTLVATFLVQIITLMLLFFITKRQLTDISENEKIDKNLSTFGWKMTLLSILGAIVDKIDNILIGVINPALLAIYYVGARIPDTIQMNSKAFVNVPTAHWSALNKSENVGKLIRYWWIFSLVGIMISAVVWVLSPWVIVTFFGEGYKDSIFVCQWLSIGITPFFLRNIVSNIDLFQGEGKYFRRITASTQIAYLILLAWLIKYRIVGIIISVLFTEFSFLFAYIVYFLYLYRKLKIPEYYGLKT